MDCFSCDFSKTFYVYLFLYNILVLKDRVLRGVNFLLVSVVCYYAVAFFGVNPGPDFFVGEMGSSNKRLDVHNRSRPTLPPEYAKSWTLLMTNALIPSVTALPLLSC